MVDGPIQPVIQPVTIDTMLNNIRPNIVDGLNFDTCEQTLTPSSAQGYWNKYFILKTFSVNKA